MSQLSPLSLSQQEFKRHDGDVPLVAVCSALATNPPHCILPPPDSSVPDYFFLIYCVV